jgi:hypothetical protein
MLFNQTLHQSAVMQLGGQILMGASINSLQTKEMGLMTI